MNSPGDEKLNIMASKKITGYILSYSKKVRDKVTEIAKAFLAMAGIQDISTNLFSCIDELIKNAIKANYKFILINDHIHALMKKNYPAKTDKELKREIADIISIRESYDHIANNIIAEEKISTQVREILNQESKLLAVRNRCYEEKRPCSNEEKKIIQKLTLINEMRKKIRERNIKVILRIEANKKYIYIEVTNTAPILTKDLNRIYEKRKEYRSYKLEGREQDFFINNLDTSESGFGLGYATIDSFLFDWGLDPERAATIISAIDTTVMLTLPIEEIRKK